MVCRDHGSRQKLFASTSWLVFRNCTAGVAATDYDLRRDGLVHTLDLCKGDLCKGVTTSGRRFSRLKLSCKRSLGLGSHILGSDSRRFSRSLFRSNGSGFEHFWILCLASQHCISQLRHDQFD